MTETAIHHWSAVALLALASATLILLSFISAPYGRHARAGWGPQVPHRIAWLIMEGPAVVGFGAWYLAGSHRLAVVPLVLFGIWQAHYIHRTFIYPFRTRTSGTSWPLTLVVLGFCFQLFNAYLNARWISHLGTYDPSWLVDFRFVAGVALFAGGLALNLWSDGLLRRLRSPGEERYRIPRGGPFELVSCPNYLGEILEWIGWAVATWSLAGLAFATYTVANLGPRARTHHLWYRERFPDYPPERKALVPFLW